MWGPVFQIIALLFGLWDSFRLVEPENDLTFTRELLGQGGGGEREGEVAISDTVAHSRPDGISIDDGPLMPQQLHKMPQSADLEAAWACVSTSYGDRAMRLPKPR